MASSPLKLNPKQQNVIRSASSQSDDHDTALVRLVQETHAPGRSLILDVKPILLVIDEILLPSTYSPADRTSSLSYDVGLRGLSYLILKIHREIIWQWLSGVNVHASTMELLGSLSSYSWEAKVVLPLAAFSVSYGKFWLVAQLCTTNALAKPLATLKQLTNITKHAESVKPQLQAIDNLIKAITNITKRIVEFAGMADTPPFSAHIPAAAYWAIRSILACASHIAILTGSRYEYNASTTMVTSQLSTLAHKLNNILKNFPREPDEYRQYNTDVASSTPLKLNPKQKNVIRRDKRGASQSDDTALVRQVQETHATGPSHIVDVKPILSVLDEIFHWSRLGTDGGVLLGIHVDSREDRASLLSYNYDDLPQGLSYVIQQIYCEIICQRLSCDDVHTSTMELLGSLSSYSWEAKVVLSLAAFSMYYGEFWLVAQLCTTNSLAKAVAILKQLIDMIEHAESVKPQLQAIDNLIKAITNVTKRIVEFSDMVKLQSQYISEDTPSLSIAMAQIPLAAYWTIRGILACASHFAILTGSRYEYDIASTTTVTDQLSTLAHKLNNILEHLTRELNNCCRYIGGAKSMAGGDVVQFLLNKFLKSFVEAESELSSPSSSGIPISTLREIKIVVEQIKINPDHGKQMMIEEPTAGSYLKTISLLYELNDKLAECRVLAAASQYDEKKRLLVVFNPLRNYFIVREMKKRLKIMKGQFEELVQKLHGSNSNTTSSTGNSNYTSNIIDGRISIPAGDFYGYNYDQPAAVYPVVRRYESSNQAPLHPVDLVFGSTHPFRAIAIVGIAGMGKTTLAKLIVNANFDYYRVYRSFASFSPVIWVGGLSNKNSSGEGLVHEDCCSIVACIIRSAEFEFASQSRPPHDVDDSNVLISSSDNISSSSDHEQRLNTLLRRMNQILSGKRYLIVLDDVWHTNDHFYSDLAACELPESNPTWDRLSYGLPKDSSGRVVVTTRRLQVAQQMLGADSVFILPVRPLADGQDCWRIFVDCFRNLDKDGSSEGNSPNKTRTPDTVALSNCKKEILDQCKGLPLAALTLAKIIPSQYQPLLRRLRD